MTEFFDRTAKVVINTIQLTGHRIAFDIEKSLKPEPNTCTLHVYNLSESQRSSLEEMRPKVSGLTKLEVTKGGKPLKATTGIPCSIEAGYQDDNAQIWLGDMRDVYSVRDGADWITVLESGDAEKAYTNGRLHVAYGPRTSPDTALRAMVRAMGVSEGNVAQVAAKLLLKGKMLTRGLVLSGPVSQHITNFCRSADLEWSIQDGAIQILDRGKALLARPILVSANTGMVGSPTVDNDGILTVKMFINPDFRVGGLLLMKAARIKGLYRTLAAKWSGDTFDGDWYITAQAKRYSDAA